MAEAKTKKTTTKKSSTKKQKYYEAVGRRKTSVSRVRVIPATKKNAGITVNGKNYTDYFKTEELSTVANAPLRKIKMLEQFYITVQTKGGGVRGQADATRHGIARALVKYDPELHNRFKKSGFLKRDPRKKERKKYGLKKARRAPQWRKR